MSSRNSKLNVIKRRLEYLQLKLTIRDHTPKSKPYLDAEISALRWAIPVLEREIESTRGDEPNG